MTTVWVIAGIVLRILLSAYFSGAEMALSACNRIRLESQAEKGSRASARALKLAENYDDTLSAILIGNNLVNITASSLTTVAVILLTGSDKLNWLGTLIVTVLVIIFGETIPKIFCKKNSNKVAVNVSGSLTLIRLIFLPVSFLVVFLVSLITKPIKDLTTAAKLVEKGRYDFDLTYSTDDEVGRLTNTFRNLANHMKDHIDDLNERVYVDALTHVRNKGAFVDYLQILQDQLDDRGGEMEFALGVFDTDDLKAINDQWGHDKGDVYIKSACRLICTVFQHSPVFRTGGDEFAVVLQNEDYENREALVQQFRTLRDQNVDTKGDRWTQASVTMGMAVYDRDLDRSVADVQRRADKAMYENKRLRKTTRGGAPV